MNVEVLVLPDDFKFYQLREQDSGGFCPPNWPSKRLEDFRAGKHEHDLAMVKWRNNFYTFCMKCHLLF